MQLFLSHWKSAVRHEFPDVFSFHQAEDLLSDLCGLEESSQIPVFPCFHLAAGNFPDLSHQYGFSLPPLLK